MLYTIFLAVVVIAFIINLGITIGLLFVYSEQRDQLASYVKQLNQIARNADTSRSDSTFNAHRWEHRL